MEPVRHDILTSAGLLILRLGIGGYMLSHGVGKLKLLIEGQWDAMGDPIGLGGALSLVLIVFAEFVCALLIMIGLATRLAAVPIVIAMGVAAFVAHGADPWTSEEAARRFFEGESQFWFSKQPALMFLIPFLALVFTGAGRFSVDGVLWPLLRARRGGQSAEGFDVVTHEEVR